MASVIMLWIDQQEDGSFKIMHRDHGELAWAEDFSSAMYFFDRWEAKYERTERQPIQSLKLPDYAPTYEGMGTS